ncbi:(2Fe-2S)-binding protein [bacterium]|nr:(2Fe-2S)-binding protein [bacterium]
MINLKINGKPVHITEGSTLLQAAEKLGIEIPTLCHLNGYAHFTSCMICMVWDKKSGSFHPACSKRAEEGMDIETDSDEVRWIRKETLDLLLSEHVGDCEAPCHRVCPAHMNIPLMIRQIQKREYRDALITVKQDIPLPAVLGRICPAPCEKICNRSQVDTPVQICLLKRYVADVDLANKNPYMPEIKKSRKKKVAVIGSGPAGLTAAYYLLIEGYQCVLFDDHPKPGGMLQYGVPEENLPRSVLDAEIDIIRKMGAAFELNTKVDRSLWQNTITKKYDAVILATGQIDPKSAQDWGIRVSEKGIWINNQTFETSVRGVFAGGNAVRSGQMAVRAVAHGKAIAYSVHQYLHKKEVAGPPKRFNSQIGKMSEKEAKGLLQETEILSDESIEVNTQTGLSESQAGQESNRCLHCDCRKPETCKLRIYADQYGAEQKRYQTSERKTVERILQHETVVYEPGKCIKCGRCVRITQKAGESLGLTFTGRGFNVRIDVPFNDSLSKALLKTAEACVEACPTAALAFKNTEEEQR